MPRTRVCASSKAEAPASCARNGLLAFVAEHGGQSLALAMTRSVPLRMAATHPPGLRIDRGNGASPKSSAERWMIAPLSSTTTRKRRCSEKNVRRCRPQVGIDPALGKARDLARAHALAAARGSAMPRPSAIDGRIDLNGAIARIRSVSCRHPRAGLRRGRCGIGAFGQRGGVEFAHEGFAGGRESGLQAAARRQHAMAAIAAKTFDQRLSALQRAHDFAERDRLRRPRQRKAAAGAALGR